MSRSPRGACPVAALVVLLSSVLVAPAAGERATGAGSDRTMLAGHAVRLGKAAAIVANAPRSVRVGATVPFTGDVVVKARRARTVQLTERRSGRWQVVSRVTSSGSGVFRFRVQAGATAGTRVFRAQAPRVRDQRLPAVTSRAVRVLVTPVQAPLSPPSGGPSVPGDDAPAGSADDWSYLFDSGSRWNPCVAIRWTYNPAGEAYAALADVTEAFARISAVSGLRFEYAGPSTYRYLGDGLLGFDGFPAGISIAVGWANEVEVDELEGDVVGIGGGSATPTAPGSDVAYRMTRGYLTVDSGNGFALAPGFDGVGWGQIMTHEVLHALGLGHAVERVQLMAPTATSANYRFGAGDITGMTRIGAPSGCLS